MRKNQLAATLVTLVLAISPASLEGKLAVNGIVPPCLSECINEEHYAYECTQFVAALENRWRSYPEERVYRRVVIDFNDDLRTVGLVKAVRFNGQSKTLEMDMEMLAARGDVSVLTRWAEYTPSTCAFDVTPEKWFTNQNAT